MAKMAVLGLPNSGALAPCIGKRPPQLARAIRLSIKSGGGGGGGSSSARSNRGSSSNEQWEVVDLPPRLNAIVLANIRSHAAGRHLWEPCKAGGRWAAQQPADGLIEIGGFVTPCHFGCYLGFGFGYASACSAVKIAQAREVKIELLEPMHLQADGEPWLQPPGVIEIEQAGTSAMLRVPSRREQRVTQRQTTTAGSGRSVA